MSDLVSHRISFLDPFFRFLNYFDSPYFFFVLIPALWLGLSYRWGLRIFYWGWISNLINSLAKYLFAWPRPSMDMPELGMFHPDSFGFPSGGAQTACFLGGILICYWKTRASWAIGLTYILLISFSRLYLGVHYPIDVVGGWFIALCLLSLFLITKKPLDHFFAAQPLFRTLLISLAIPLLLLWICPVAKIAYFTGGAMGIGLGTYISLKHHLFLPDVKRLATAVPRALFGIALLFLIVFLWPTPDFSQAFAIAFFMSAAASPLCRSMKLEGK